MGNLDVIQTLTEVANISLLVRKMGNELSDAQTKLQLSRSMIETAIYELEAIPKPDRPFWLIEYLREGLEHLK